MNFSTSTLPRNFTFDHWPFIFSLLILFHIHHKWFLFNIFTTTFFIDINIIKVQMNKIL